MKKLILILLAVFALALTIPVTGCNKQIIDLNYKFDRANIYVNGEWKDIAIKGWADYENSDQIQITLKDGTVMLIHSEDCVLYKGQLP